MRAVQFVSPDWHMPGAFLLLALAFIALEFAYGRLARHDEMHDARETLASIGIAIGNLATKAATGGIAAVPFPLVYQHRPTDIPLDAAWSWLALFLGVEFLYYWFHRTSFAGSGQPMPCTILRRASIYRPRFGSDGPAS
jgi:sterol desaturase/sphingolipid hydroxylase (fatty acid hydroxylase superfamily)